MALTLWVAQKVKKVLFQYSKTAIQFSKEVAYVIDIWMKLQQWSSLFCFFLTKLNKNISQHPCPNYTSLAVMWAFFLLNEIIIKNFFFLGLIVILLQLGLTVEHNQEFIHSLILWDIVGKRIKTDSRYSRNSKSHWRYRYTLKSTVSILV